jgi:potassium efflux system protein
MRAQRAIRHALTVACLAASLPAIAPADDPPARLKKAEASPKLPPLPGSDAPSTASPAPAAPVSPPLPPTTLAEASREKLATEAARDDKEKPPSKPVLELLQARLALLEEWKKANDDRLGAEKPKRSPEAEAAELKAELEKTLALLEQAGKSPDALLPEAFRAVEKEKEKDKEAEARRLGEMKEAIDAARAELKEQTTRLEALRAEGSRALTAEAATLRADRDKVFQALAGLNAQRGERRAALASMAAGEGRDLARERFSNLEWQARVEAEKLAAIEAKSTLIARRIGLGAAQVEVHEARVKLARTMAERMEARFNALADRQRVALKQAEVQEKTRAASLVDPLEKRRAQRTAQLLELESQVVAFEKAFATSSGVSFQAQAALKDHAVTEFEELKKLLDDGTVSPLDALRLKNDFRRIGPERAQIVRTDLAASEAELTRYENALTDAEIDLVNDSRDDRFDRESLLEQLPEARRAEASAMLDELESRHKALLNRRRDVLRNLASRAEEAHTCVLKRIETLDLQYAFIRTHIFWIRDAEPLGATTLAHARDDSVRTAKALVHLAMEAGDRSLWSHPSVAFVLAAASLVVLPLPLWWGRRSLDRMRLAVPSAR